MKRLFATLFLCSAVSVAHAEIAQKFGPLEIHYNALTTDELSPEVARTYKIERSKTRGMVTMSVLKKNAVGATTPVPARLTVYATNLSQQLATVEMREIREGDREFTIWASSVWGRRIRSGSMPPSRWRASRRAR